MRARCAYAWFRILLLVIAGAAGLFLGGTAFAQDDALFAHAVPSFEELELLGALIGKIEIDARNIFDVEDPKEDKALFRLANTLHIQTRPGVIERQLLFKSGERLSKRVIDETERLLRSNHYLYDVQIIPAAYHDGVVDIVVRTRDTWTLAPGISFSRAGGANTRGASLREYNALGTGVYFGLTRTSDPDRSATEYRVTQNQAFGGWTTIDYAMAHLDDGRRDTFSVAKPFYALDTRSAGGFSVMKDTRVDSVYAGGALAGQFRHDTRFAEVSGGWSQGLVGGWARRYTVGASYETDRYELEPGRPVPAQLPDDVTLASPFVRYEIIEDDYDKVHNRDQIARPEYFQMGFHSRVQLGRSLLALGSTRALWTYAADVSNGFDVLGGNALLASASASGRFGEDGGVENQLAGGQLRFYSRRHGNEHALFYASLSADAARVAGATDPLLLGGDNGMRGYPMRYQSGDRRAVLTLEERGYSDLYPFQLFRLGGAIFWDTGRAWGGESQNTAYPGWLTDVGFGLRILSARTAFGNVLHLDFAFPLTHDPSIPSFQFSVQVKTSL